MNYGRIDFIYQASKGITKVGEEFECETKEIFDKTLLESLDCGVPLIYHIYNSKKLSKGKEYKRELKL